MHMGSVSIRMAFNFCFLLLTMVEDVKKEGIICYAIDFIFRSYVFTKNKENFILGKNMYFLFFGIPYFFFLLK